MNNSPRYPQRVRNDLRFRELTVLRVERISAGFQRIVLGGEALDGFTSRGFDDHSKLFFPQPDAHFVPPTVTEEGIVWPDHAHRRVTIRRCMTNYAMNWRSISLFTTVGSPAAGQCQAQPGDKLTVAGPRGSLVVPEDYAYQLYVCDESGMPALRRRLETLSKLAVKPQVSALVSVRDNACQDYLAHLDGFNIEWLAHDEQAVDARLAQMQIPADDYFIWITGEGKVVRL